MILLTGGTGFLGRELLGRMLLRRDQELALLVRSGQGKTAEEKVQETIQQIFPRHDAAQFLNRIRVIAGDLELPQFGIGESAFKRLASSTTEIYHCAASTHLALPLEEARAINVAGTSNIIELSRAAKAHGNDVRLQHLSTAYVAGSQSGIVTPDDLRLDIEFRNGYEQSKAESERLVRACVGEFQINIFRPSIIVGDSITGQTSAFHVIYIPAKLIAKGIFQRFPAYPSVPFDVVPVDYVVDAILEIGRAPHESGSCFHLCAGVGRESSVWEIIETLIATFNKYRLRGKDHLSMPQQVTAELLLLAQNSISMAVSRMKALEKIFGQRFNVLKQILPFIPYLTSNPQFDSTKTAKALDHSLGLPPMFHTYAEQVFRYCLETNWGRDPWNNPSNFLSWYERSDDSRRYHRFAHGLAAHGLPAHGLQR